MGKRKSNSANAAIAIESTVSPILEVNYKDPLFTVAAHPSKPILLSGLVTGHVYCNSYDAEKLEEAQSAAREKFNALEKEAFAQGKIGQITKSVSQLKNKWWTIIEDHTEIEEASHIVTNWKTKRHKGSCRHAIFDPLPGSLGESIFTIGTDHTIKRANTETGKVIGKANIVEHFENKSDSVTKLCHSSTNPFLLTGTEDGHVLVFDSKNLGENKIKFKVPLVHDDSVNQIMAMPSVSAYHYLSLGSTTLSHIDIRKGIVTQSDSQDDELLSMCYGMDKSSTANDTVLVGHGEGIVTIWKNSKNRFMDQLSRIKVNKTASIDAIMPTMNEDDDEQAASVWCGDSEGLLHRVNYKRGKVVETRVHSSARGKYGAADEVGILDIDYDYRLISAGMDSLKIWSGQDYEYDSESDSDSDDSDDSLGSEEFAFDSDKEDKEDKSDDEQVEENGEDENSDESNASDDSDEAPEEDTQPKIARRRPFPGTAPSTKKKTLDLNSKVEPEPAEPVAKKPKVKQMSTKQLKNLQKHEHGIRRFEGL
ncbi:uncharacterized protein CANTADRAFT_90284 [Suhomyces tanzawaensis NRRL Y-17324]|uniref:WD repeat-containing protein JIP5 n=1 Tax=Suhomyces tanzawaensis NRRL Y-17324 TaxID=984487 RepID=A0A1E4SI79_9ASCO|nr:uncharacterized protein CANTADRAFT_90284 [Suhomyces tanzawaensis NRRL Y-17324]ODV79180.1 hypothetical protein CANTADRAFT_90284 [Suhomyces tanzawaensis NRRL Y-17324]